MKAVWELDYDHVTDKCYKRPMCPKCFAPIYKIRKEKYECLSCRHTVKVKDPEMLKWFEEREGTKIEIQDCFTCHKRQCVETHFIKNRVTLEWQTAWGECKSCGAKFIV